MKLSMQQRDIIDAPLGPIAVTACAGSGKTETAIRRLIAVREKMESSRGRVVLLSFSNVAVNTFNTGYAGLASALPDDINRRRVEVDTLDGFFTKHILRPHAYRTMATDRAAYLVSGSEPFLTSFQYWRKGSHPLPLKDIKVGMFNKDFYFVTSKGDELELLDKIEVIKIVNRLGKTGAYTHDLGRYWVYQTLVSQPTVLRALAARYPQILVDESQDLGTVHQEILELLIGAGVQVTLIGDVNQGIYGFAGADGEFLKSYETRAEVSGYKLTRNYRSLPPIINIANSLCGRDDEPDRQNEQGGAFFIGYKEAELPELTEAFKAHIDELGIQLQDSVILCRGAARAEVIAGRASPHGQGMVKVLAEASLLRDQHNDYHGCFKLVCRAIIGLLDNAPHGLSSGLQGFSHEDGMSGLKRLLWRFSRSTDLGLPSSALSAKTDWHTKLLTNVKALLAEIEKQYEYKIAGTLGTKLTKKLLPDLPLASAVVTQAHGFRVETVHQVKGESIGAVMYLAKKKHIEALLSGTGDEEGRIGYVAITRAKNLFWLAVPQSCLKDLKDKLINAGFRERVKSTVIAPT
ncbi:ATP-dependent helicase [Citrobacter braakii]|uniref:UvrD-helicase domain-containing protein n=1 Tax=Citrobacter TaxID=544 RepID=UPI0023B33149|nr:MULTISPECIES: ATP-dependent helicase [Citrobacter]MDE9688939.1 ATP-dependent helicase [Citrobacter portucalensis]MDM3359618.1 ATP-dependent helicase [Citrobacter sp. Cb002]HAX9835776.1 UvrD-helicase domain-containing protein [Escherichia coli]